MKQAQWWRGTRGEWFVVIQALILALVVLGPRTLTGLPAWPAALANIAGWVGLLMLAAGGVTSVIAALHLGPNLTPLPHPKDSATLIESGLYGIVRHPIYFALIVMAVAWALFVQGTLTLLYAALLVAFFDIKARREEKWLARRFPAYEDYSRRVKKLIPYIY